MVTAPALDVLTLLELQAALRAGAGPAEAVAATCAGGNLDEVARRTRLGQSLAAVATAAPPRHPSAAFLVRCLALTERSGGGGAEAVDHALEAIRDDADLHRLLDVRTAQARGTAVILGAIPLAAWLLLVAVDGSTLAFYATPLGWLSGGVSVGMAAVAWRWMRRLIATAGDAAAAADPLHPPAPPPAWRRGVVTGGLAAVPLLALTGPAPAVAAATVIALAVARRNGIPAKTDGTPAGGAQAGGAAEAVSLVAVALEAGMAPVTALAEAGHVAPGAAAPLLRSAARRLAAGWNADEVLADTPLAPLGASLAAAHRWGAPAAPALRALAAELRAQRRAAVEVAAERLQLTLIFPTTLLTLPAFVLGIVPPLLWSTVRG